MALKNLKKILKIISYVGRNPQCLTSDTKDFLNFLSEQNEYRKSYEGKGSYSY